MKKIFFPTLFLLAIAGAASAQTSKNKSATYTSTTSHKAKNSISEGTGSIRTESPVSTTIIPDNRKEYEKDGQLATFTGHEAAPTNGEQFQSLKDTAKRRKH